MPYRNVPDGAGGTRRVWWPKYIKGKRPTKAASLAYWAARERAEKASGSNGNAQQGDQPKDATGD